MATTLLGAVVGIPSVTKSERAYLMLRQAIIQGVLRPNDPIYPLLIANELGMSIIPVREALRRLEQEGLVVNKPHVGVTVREFPVEDVCENLLIRSELEPLAVRLATPYMNPALQNVLSSILDDMDKRLLSNEYDEFGRLNKHFHLTIYSVLRERQLLNIIKSLWEQVPRSGSVLVVVPDHAAKAQKEHRAIFDAVIRGDAESAAALTRYHKINSLNALRAAISIDTESEHVE